ncbi:MAG TPA: extracellular solute-binding protein, partial [Aggregatilineales bacterium]|nr:extracellular solute-binding protein [Aggregatilineales bacterium]
VIGGATMWLTNGLDAEVEDGALTFLIYLIDTENMKSWHQLTGYIPIRVTTSEALVAEGWFETNPNQTVAADQLAQSQITPATSGALVGGLPAIRTEVTGAIDRVLLTDEDPAELLNAAVEEANVIIEEYNLLNVD